MAYGVRKVNEFIIRDGRALILTQNIAAGSSQEQWDSLADGTIYLDPETGNLKYKKRGNAIKTWTQLAPENLFAEKSIKENLIADGAITTNKYAVNSINQIALQENCIDATNIKEASLTNKNFLTGSITGEIITDDTLNGSKLKNESIEGVKIKRNSLNAGDLIQGGTITNLCYGAASIPTTAFINKSITGSLLADRTISSNNYGLKSIDDSILKDGTIKNRSLGDGCVEESNIAQGSISNALLKADCVRENNIVDGSITNNKIANNTIEGNSIADGTIDNSKIQREAISLECLEQDIQETIREAVIVKDGRARIAGTLEVDKDIVSSSDKVYSITGFKVYNPIFADFAEGFVAAEPVEPGDIVEVDKNTCIRKAGRFSRKVIGVVSDQYGICLDASEEEIESGAKVAIGLTGKVFVNVFGSVEAGDFIVSCGHGVGYATKKYIGGTIIGKALEDKESLKIGKVLCLINAM